MNPIKIFILMANPISRYRNHFQVIPKLAVRTMDLRHVLLDHQPPIVHFAGHGEVSNISRAAMANQGHEEVPSSPQSRKFSPVFENAADDPEGGLVFEDVRGHAKLLSVEVLAAQNPAKIKRSFRMYRRRASDRFYQVDVTLKRLCDELRAVGEPLASVLSMLE